MMNRLHPFIPSLGLMLCCGVLGLLVSSQNGPLWSIAHAQDGPAAAPGSNNPAGSPPSLLRHELWTLPAIGARDPSLDFLPGEDQTRSRSIGDVSSGFLVNGRKLALPHPYLAVLDVQSKRHLIYGTDQMIALVEATSRFVHKQHPGSITYLGNIGRMGGGDIRWSVSHNSGRDADLAFFVKDEQGNPAVMPDLLALDEEGRYEGEHGTFVFDVPRNWSLVEGLIRHGGDSLQYIFVANWLRDKLLLYGRANGASADVLKRATSLLQQPRATLPHNDHFHVRLFCAPSDVEVGCKNSGRFQPWLKRHNASKKNAITRAMNALNSVDANERLAGVRRLALLGSSSSSKPIIGRLQDSDARVRAAAVRTLSQLRRGDRALASLLKREKHPMVVLELMDALRQLKTSASTRALIYTLEHGQTLSMQQGDLKIDTRVLAAQSLAWTESKLPVKPLIARLEDEDPQMRAASVYALQFLTNHRFYKRWHKKHKSKRSKKRLQSAIESWRQWYEKHRRMRRSKWVVLGFQQAGLKVDKINKKHVWSFCRAIDSVPYTTYNAQRALMRISGHNARSLRWSYEDANYYWRRWFERRQRKFRLPRIPKDLSTKDGYQKFLKQQEQKKLKTTRSDKISKKSSKKSSRTKRQGTKSRRSRSSKSSSAKSRRGSRKRTTKKRSSSRRRRN